MLKIWFERQIPPNFVHLLDDSFECLNPDNRTPEEHRQALREAHGAVASIFRYDAELMDSAPNLLVISRTGIGYDKVDIASATERGIAVCNAPDGPTISTAEQALMLLFAVAKKLKKSEYELRHSGKSHFYEEHTGIELYGKRLGLIGFGRISRHVATVAQAMGMQVQAYDPFIDADDAKALGVELKATMESVLSSADVVSVHVPLSPETRGLLGAEQFAQMKPGAIFINTARGGLVDETALYEALDSGHLFGAGLDVMEPFPMQADNPLLNRHDVVVTPHIASATTDGKRRIYETTLMQVFQVLRGEKPPHLINPEVWSRVVERLNA